MSRDTYKDALNANKTKFNTKRRQENYIYWKFLKVHGRRSA